MFRIRCFLLGGAEQREDSRAEVVGGFDGGRVAFIPLLLCDLKEGFPAECAVGIEDGCTDRDILAVFLLYFFQGLLD